MKTFLTFVALAVPAAAFAQAPSTVALNSKIFVAKTVTGPDGKSENKLFAPDTVTPGDALVFMHDYKNGGAKPATAFEINNPVPPSVAFTGVEQAWATVSVDGGKSFAALAALKVKGADGKMRPAIPGDVTHVKWKFAQAIAPGAGGRVMYYGVVK